MVKFQKNWCHYVGVQQGHGGSSKAAIVIWGGLSCTSWWMVRKIKQKLVFIWFLYLAFLLLLLSLKFGLCITLLGCVASEKKKVLKHVLVSSVHTQQSVPCTVGLPVAGEATSGSGQTKPTSSCCHVLYFLVIYTQILLAY